MNRQLQTNVVLVAAGAVVAAAVVKELRKPSTARTWTGRVFGLPYDFRLPSPEKIAREFWDPDSDAFFTPHAFGIGYGVNLARVARELRRSR
ncbi:DUF5808 domain-containing protein [Streptomyces sp. Li-HN-5-11]|uniref:DUF5808 domain-containing protein n=1 Tax=Streptomyces sp. Li-HN-5-11 TaxID=3075432 RepID=UPI0028AA31B4|nr:DUF5808 domain-containing protein [Streptomyces sp. Li-HN-5-11]WNM31239.1 DUF5808 domain-containing protein [Streptomyces sp. Li-HN-5-11]